MNLEIGMYCYDKSNRKSGIGKIIEFRKNNNAVIEYRSGVVLISVGNIIASHNLIDLIDKGDYVNGYKVSFKGNDYKPFVQCDYPVQEGKTNHYRFYENEIYSIVTKEQFNSTKYVVGEQE